MLKRSDGKPSPEPEDLSPLEKRLQLVLRSCGSEPCPSPETLIRVGEHGRRCPDFDRVMDHAAICSHCRQALLQVNAAEKAARASAPGVWHLLARRPQLYKWSLAVSGLLVLIMVCGYFLRHQPGIRVVEPGPGPRRIDPSPHGAVVCGAGDSLLLGETEVVPLTRTALLRFSISEGQTYVDVLSGAVGFRPVSEDNKLSSKLRVRALGAEVRPSGTIFKVSVDYLSRSISVLEGEVEVTIGAAEPKKTKKTPAGQVLVLTDGQDVRSEPLADYALPPLWKLSDPPYLVQEAMKTGGIQRVMNFVPLPRSVDLDLRSLAAKEYRYARSARPCLETAILLGRWEERAAAADALCRALERDWDLRCAKDEELWELLRVQAVGMGDRDVALRIAELLEDRGHEGEYLRLWVELVESSKETDFDPQGRYAPPLSYEPWIRMGRAALKLAQFGYQEDRPHLGEALRTAAEALHSDPTLLRKAIELLRAYVADRGPATRAQIGFAHHRLNEALYWAGLWKESVYALRNAIEVWPVPRWKVHLAGRLCEVFDVEQEPGLLVEARQLCVEGLAGDLSVYTCDRALNMLFDAARTSEDARELKEFALWIPKAFPNALNAAFSASRWLYKGFADEPWAAPRCDQIIRQAADKLCRGVESLPEAYRVVYEEFRRRANLPPILGPRKTVSEDESEEQKIKIVLDGGSFAADNPNLLIRFARLRLSKAEAQNDEKMRKAAIRLLQEGLQNEQRSRLLPDKPLQPLRYVTTLLVLAEALHRSPKPEDSKQARVLAREVQNLLPELPGYALRYKWDRIQWSARAYWILGDRDKARRALEEVAHNWPLPNEARSEARALLRKLEQKK